MSQLSIQLSDKADALIAQLQKEIFNRRRKKVTAAGVVESLVESGARSQSDKRFATSWANLIKDIEKAAKLADAHGSKPSSLSDEEWVLVLSHRARLGTTSGGRKPAKRATTRKPAAAKTTAAKTTAAKTAAAKTAVARKSSARAAAADQAPESKPRPARRARKSAAAGSTNTSVAKRMAKAVGRLGTTPLPSLTSGGNGISSPARS
jgi:topoisomerase IA-like protein